MTPKLYHKDVYLPAPVKEQASRMKGAITLSKHAIREITSDRYGQIALPRFVDAARAEIIEVEHDTRLNRVLKAVIRFAMDATRDVVLVICPDGLDALFVKTCWINLKSDPHQTLDRSRYVTA